MNIQARHADAGSGGDRPLQRIFTTFLMNIHSGTHTCTGHGNYKCMHDHFETIFQVTWKILTVVRVLFNVRYIRTFITCVTVSLVLCNIVLVT